MVSTCAVTILRASGVLPVAYPSSGMQAVEGQHTTSACTRSISQTLQRRLACPLNGIAPSVCALSGLLSCKAFSRS